MKIQRKQPMVIIVGPSGVGKSSLVDLCVKSLPYFVDIITYTTRTMRPKEKNGDPYFFVDQEKFKKLKGEKFFVEWAQVHTNFYGTPRDQIEKAWKDGKVVIIDVDVQGAKSIKSEYPHVLTVFISPPSMETLRQRLEGRDGAKAKDIELRLSNAIKEMDIKANFDRQLTNDDLSQAFQRLKKMIEEYLASA